MKVYSFILSLQRAHLHEQSTLPSTHDDLNRVNSMSSKPVMPSSLSTAVSSTLAESKPSTSPPPSSVQQSGLPRLSEIRILVVDDSEINLELAQLLLESEGATIYLAENGQEALSWLEVHPDDVDLILMDIQMPIMDGYTATQLIRQNPRWTHLPIIALSAGVLKEEQDRAIAAGMNNFIAKPFNIDQLVELIQTLTQQAQTLTASPITTAEDNDVSVDLSEGLAQWGKESVYRTYLNKFIELYQNAGHDLTHSLTQGDIKAGMELTHKLKGVAGTLALKTVASQATALNAALKNGIIDIEAAKALQKSIEQSCRTIRAWAPKTDQS